MHFAAEPEGQKVGQCDEQHQHSGWKSCVQIAVRKVDLVCTTGVPDEEREDRDGGDGEERKKSRRNRKQHALEEAEAFKWEAENIAAGVLILHCMLHRLW